MGDHRWSCDIEIEFHGETYTMVEDDTYNFVKHDRVGIPIQIVNFLEDAFKDGFKRFYEEMERIDEERRKDEIEARELRELARLREKYEKKGKKT